MFKHTVRIAWLLGFTSLSLAQSPERQGLAIAEKAHHLNTGFGDMSANLTLVLHNKEQQTSKRSLRLWMLETPYGDKTRCCCDHPKDIKGVSLLTITHKQKNNDQWLYLPALKRVKRIIAANSASSFMGSEFSYSDFASSVLEKYTYEYIRDESYEDQRCFVVSVTPKKINHRGYHHRMLWFDQTHHRTLKVEYYGQRDNLVKTLTLSNYRLFMNTFWRPCIMTMVNYETEKSSELIWTDIRFQTGLKDRDFTTHSLTRPQ
jgi:hypothetical protein